MITRTIARRPKPNRKSPYQPTHKLGPNRSTGRGVMTKWPPIPMGGGAGGVGGRRGATISLYMCIHYIFMHIYGLGGALPYKQQEAQHLCP